jgi:hypothetical protein
MGDDVKNQAPNILGDFPESEQWRIGQMRVSLAAQQEYLDYHTNDLGQYQNADISITGKKLLSRETSLDDKKKALAILAHTGSIEAFRVLEEYAEKADEELAEWAVLALQECQVFLEASLTDQSTAMITSGLGGAGHKMRYFFAVPLKEYRAWENAERAVVELTFREIGNQLDSEIERIQFCQGYVAVEILIPLEVAVAEFAEMGIRATNRVGDFLEEDYWVTNYEIPTEDEIKNWAQEVRGQG